MKSVLKKLNINLSILILICIFTTNVQAQIQLFPLDNLTDGYLELQNNKVPMFESLQEGDACLLDHDWCHSTVSQLPPAAIYDGNVNSSRLLAIIDTQLVLIQKDAMFINNGFFMLKGISSEVDDSIFKMTGYSHAADLFKLQEHPLKTHVVKSADALNFFNMILSSGNDQSDEVEVYTGNGSRWISREDALKLLEDQLNGDQFGNVWVMVDGVLVYMRKSSLSGLLNATSAIEVSV